MSVSRRTQNNEQQTAAQATVKAVFCFVCYLLVAHLRIHPYLDLLFLGLTGLSILKLMRALLRDWWHGRALKKASTPTGLYGSTKAVGLRDLLEAGIRTTNEDGNGIPIGAIGNKLLFYDGAAHVSIRAATGAGKTESSSAPIGLALGAHRNLVIMGKGREPAELIAEYRESIGQDVMIIDIGNQMKGTRFKTHAFNFCSRLVALAAAQDPELIDQASGTAQALIKLLKSTGDARFFILQGQKYLKDILIACACWEARTGELVCNLPHIYSKINNDEEVFRAFLIELSTLDDFGGTVANKIKRILSKWRNSVKTFESVLSESENGLELFDPSSHIGQTSVMSDFDPADIKRKPITIIIVTDPTKSGTHGMVAGLYLDAITNVALQAGNFEPRVTIVADEFANLSSGPLPSILPTLYTGRGLGVQLITYVQDTSTYKDRYGDEASAFTTQCDVTLAWKCRSTEDAEEYSKRSGQISVMTENVNLPDEVAKRSGQSFSLGLSEKGLARFRPDQFLHMGEFEAALFFKQLPAVMIDMVSYQQVMPWREYAGKLSNGASQAKLPVKFHL